MTRKLGRFVETFRGSSFPTRSETADGTDCIVKMRGAGNGDAALVSEFVVNRIAHAAGWPVPDAFVVGIDAEFLWEFGTDEFHDLVKKSGGPNLGLSWIEGARPIRAEDYNTLPHAFVAQVVTLDLVFANCDRSVRSENLLADRARRQWIVDHGSCRFLADPRRRRSAKLPADHAFAGWEEAFDPTLLAAVNEAVRREIVAAIPAEWLSGINLTRTDVVEALAVRLA